MTQTDGQVDGELDRIDRSIEIDASAERVWSLVPRPGWWINDEEVDPEPELRQEGDVDVLVHPKHGEFRLQTLEADRPRYVAFLWIDNVAPEAGTTVEFWIERPARRRDAPGGRERLLQPEQGPRGDRAPDQGEHPRLGGRARRGPRGSSSAGRISVTARR